MRFQKPDGVVQDVSNNAVVCSADVEDFCVPADKVWRKGCQWDPGKTLACYLLSLAVDVY